MHAVVENVRSILSTMVRSICRTFLSTIAIQFRMCGAMHAMIENVCWVFLSLHWGDWSQIVTFFRLWFHIVISRALRDSLVAVFWRAISLVVVFEVVEFCVEDFCALCL